MIICILIMKSYRILTFYCRPIIKMFFYFETFFLYFHNFWLYFSIFDTKFWVAALNTGKLSLLVDSWDDEVFKSHRPFLFQLHENSWIKTGSPNLTEVIRLYKVDVLNSYITERRMRKKFTYKSYKTVTNFIQICYNFDSNLLQICYENESAS